MFATFVQYMYLSRTLATPQISSWHVGKTKPPPAPAEMASGGNLAWQRTCNGIQV